MDSGDPAPLARVDAGTMGQSARRIAGRGPAMPRIAKAREGAEPTSDVQRERQVRILTAAARLGSEHELARVQMAEVAKDAGVAIGTLYRYFPSKTHLFVALLLSQLERARDRLPDPPPGMAPTPGDLRCARRHDARDRRAAPPRVRHARVQQHRLRIGGAGFGRGGASLPGHRCSLRAASNGPRTEIATRCACCRWCGSA